MFRTESTKIMNNKSCDDVIAILLFQRIKVKYTFLLLLKFIFYY